MQINTKKSRLHKLLADAGIPIDGIGGEDGPNCRIDFQDAATDEQKASAATIVAAFDWNADTSEQDRREAAKAEVVRNDPPIVGRRADSIVIYQAIVATRQRHNAMLDALVAKGTLTEEEASPFRQPIRTMEEVIASRQAIIDAGLAEV